MLKFLKNSAIVLALAGSAIALTATASAEHRGSVVSIGFGNIAIGYRDGYWDNSHRWHRWHNEREHRSYRSHYSNGYSDWNHDRDGNDGWRDHRRHR